MPRTKKQSAEAAMREIPSSLAWALIFGLFASTAFTLLVVPVIYYVVYPKDSVDDGTLVDEPS